MTTLATQLERDGLSLHALGQQHEAVILFGSRAAELARDDSDWDILIVGHGQSRLRRGLDLVYVEPDSFGQDRWRSSELAGHIGRWGVTLCGRPSWLAQLQDTKIGAEAIAHKRRQVEAQLGACERYWSSLAPWARTTRQRRLRRDLQRHARLRESVPIPPSALLDHEWTQLSLREQSRSLARWLAFLDLDGRGGPWLAPLAAGTASGLYT